MAQEVRMVDDNSCSELALLRYQVVRKTDELQSLNFTDGSNVVSILSRDIAQFSEMEIQPRLR